MKDKNHLHRYRKLKMGKNKDYIVYACQDPGCKHYISSSLVVGKVARCFYCKEAFVIDREQVRKGQLKLRCNACKKGKQHDSKQVENFMSRLGLSAND